MGQFEHFGYKALCVTPLDMDEEMDGVGDVGFDGLVRELDPALEDATGKPGKGLGRGIGVNGGKTSAVSCVEGLKKIKCLFSRVSLPG